MIKVRAGQVWFSSFSGKEITMTKNDEDRDFNSPFYKFIPQNDLEWLAVNIEKFPTGIFNYLFWDAENIKHGIENTTFNDWQNMRYHLGQDKKPRYRLTGGEWVKQCKK